MILDDVCRSKSRAGVVALNPNWFGPTERRKTFLYYRLTIPPPDTPERESALPLTIKSLTLATLIGLLGGCSAFTRTRRFSSQWGLHRCRPVSHTPRCMPTYWMA